MIRLLSVKDKHPGITRNDNDSFTKWLDFDFGSPASGVNHEFVSIKAAPDKQLISSREQSVTAVTDCNSLLFQFFQNVLSFRDVLRFCQGLVEPNTSMFEKALRFLNVKQKTWNHKIVPGSKQHSNHDVRSSLTIHTCLILSLSTGNSGRPREPKQPRFDNYCLGAITEVGWCDRGSSKAWNAACHACPLGGKSLHIHSTLGTCG